MPDRFPAEMVLPLAPIFREAICRGLDSDTMFPERGDSIKVLREACRACPARSECLVLALRNGERHGVWGGLSGKTLTSLRVRGWVEHVGEEYFYDDRDHELVIAGLPSEFTPREARAVLRDRVAARNEQRALPADERDETAA